MCACHDHIEELRETLEAQVLTYDSTVRLMHADSKYHLHSHDISYGSGSGQQSVTGLKGDTDHGSLWRFRPGDGLPERKSGELIKCNDIVRLTHLSTNKNLHSHDFSSPVSNYQEISAYGKKGEGDSGDDW